MEPTLFKQKIFYYLFLFCIFTFFSLSVLNLYQRIISVPNKSDRMNLHYQIIEGKANSPYRYRILYPYLTENLLKSDIKPNLLDLNTIVIPFYNVGPLTDKEYAFIQVWYLLDFIFIFFIFLSTFLFLHRFSLGYKLLACFLTQQALNAVLIGHAYQPWSIVEGSLFPFAFFLISKIKTPKNYIYLLSYVLLVLIATLNRETGLFIAAFFVINWIVDKRVKEFRNWILLILVSGVLILGFIRMWKGFAPHEHTLQEIYKMNISGSNINLMKYELQNMFNIFWVPIGLGMILYWRKLLRYIILILLYLPFYLIFGLWGEARLLIPLFSIFIYSSFLFLTHISKIIDNKASTH